MLSQTKLLLAVPTARDIVWRIYAIYEESRNCVAASSALLGTQIASHWRPQSVADGEPTLRLRTAPGVSGHVNEHATGVYGWKTGASTTSVIGASAAGVQGVLACPSPEIV